MLKAPKSQKVPKLLSQKARNQVLNLHHRQQPVYNRRLVRKTNKFYQQKQRRQDKQKIKNKQINRVRSQNQQTTNIYVK